METINDIIREMRDEVRTSWENNPDPRTRIFLSTSNMALEEFADRIEAAANGLRTENEMLKDEIKCKTQNYEDVIRAKDQELARLRATLKPILEVEWHMVWDETNGWKEYGVPLPSLAVREAHRIYKKEVE